MAYEFNEWEDEDGQHARLQVGSTCIITHKSVRQIQLERARKKKSGNSEIKFQKRMTATKREMDTDGMVADKYIYPSWNDPAIPRAQSSDKKPSEPEIYRTIYNVRTKKGRTIREAVLDVNSMTATYSYFTDNRIKYGSVKVVHIEGNMYWEEGAI